MKIQNLMPFLYVLFAGIIIPPALALNANVGRNLKSPLLSAFVVMFVGGIFIGGLSLITKQIPPSPVEFSKTPVYIWFGGIFISLNMALMIYSAPKIGIGLATSLVVTGQMIAGLIIDHFGLFALPQASMSVGRLFGFIAIITGVVLVKFF